MKAHLVLSDGTLFEGEAFGAIGRTEGEVVFNTGMTGYQEILTDPSYAGQIVTLTYPLIGNYGINLNDFESRRVQVQGFVVREVDDMPSNWRSAQTLDSFLRERGIVGIKGIDTRALTRALRVRGVMMGTISSNESPAESLSRLEAAPDYGTIDFNKWVTTEKSYRWRAHSEAPQAEDDESSASEAPKYRIALLDCGVKYNIIRSLSALGCETTVFPCTATADEMLESKPDGVMLSPGPGDPAHLGYVVETVRTLVGKVPIMGVCLGNQLLGYAFGSDTYKLKFGHRGANHPVKDLRTGKVTITSQNHGYSVDPDKLQNGMEVAHVNLNDGTVEGLRHRELPIFSIQYHPEASPGPEDSSHFFREFIEMIDQTYQK